jgi:hypothetical protein
MWSTVKKKSLPGVKTTFFQKPAIRNLRKGTLAVQFFE